MSGSAPHFVLASWLLAGAFIFFGVCILVGVVASLWVSRGREVGVIESVRTLVHARMLSGDEGRELLQRYEGERA